MHTKDTRNLTVSAVWVVPLTALLMLTGCIRVEKNSNGNTLDQDALRAATQGYLVTHIGLGSFGGQVYCASHILGSAQKESTTEAYLWVLCQEYYWENGKLALGTGASLPVALILESRDGDYSVTGHRVPRDGSLYGKDVRSIFPRSIQAEILSVDPSEYNQRAQALEHEVERQARIHMPRAMPSPTPTHTSTPRLAPTHTSAPSPTPTHTATPGSTPVPPTATPTCTVSPQKVLGISPSPPSTDTVVYARQDGAVVLHTLANAGEQVLLDPGTYDTTGDNFLIAIGFPARLSPDGQWLLVPTPERGTWLISMAGGATPRKLDGRLSFTWSPDSRRIAFQRQGAIYIQDVVAGTDPVLVFQSSEAELYYPTWSPSGDSPGSIAAYSCMSDICAVWLVDVASGNARELGHIAPLPMMTTPDMIQWTADGAAVLVQGWQGTLAFPVQGGGPQPLAGVWYDRHGTPSPDGLLEAWTEAAPEADFSTRLVVARVGTEHRFAYNLTFEQIQRLAWTNDGRRLLIEDYAGRERLWAVDPAVGEPVLFADHILYFGTLDQLRQRSIGGGTPVVPLRALPYADDPLTWRSHSVSGWPVCLRFPPAWRVKTRSNSRTRVIWQVMTANFEFTEQAGIVALTEDHIEVSFEYHARPSDGRELALDRVKEMQRGYAAVESTTLGSYPAIRIRPLISPVSEELRVQLDGGQLWITYKPLSPTQQAVLDQILAQLDLEQSCPIPR